MLHFLETSAQPASAPAAVRCAVACLRMSQDCRHRCCHPLTHHGEPRSHPPHPPLLPLTPPLLLPVLTLHPRCLADLLSCCCFAQSGPQGPVPAQVHATSACAAGPLSTAAAWAGLLLAASGPTPAEPLSHAQHRPRAYAVTAAVADVWRGA